jgi:predicted ribosome-associated RNA-binding protein Tma20
VRDISNRSFSCVLVASQHVIPIVHIIEDRTSSLSGIVVDDGARLSEVASVAIIRRGIVCVYFQKLRMHGTHFDLQASIIV